MKDNAREKPDTAGVIAPPPLLYLGTLASGLLLGRKFPIPFQPRSISKTLGWPLILGGLLLGFMGDRAMHRARTNINPYKPTTTIVTEGPYRFTRNPLYLSLTLMYGGIAARANSLWATLLLPILLLVMKRGVIEREERYLERKFGAEYLSYKSQVRRWI